MAIALQYHSEPAPRSLMAAFMAAHHYAVRVQHWPQRGCGVRTPPYAAINAVRAGRSRTKPN